MTTKRSKTHKPQANQASTIIPVEEYESFTKPHVKSQAKQDYLDRLEVEKERAGKDWNDTNEAIKRLVGLE